MQREGFTFLVDFRKKEKEVYLFSRFDKTLHRLFLLFWVKRYDYILNIRGGDSDLRSLLYEVKR
jgi:hypothetical protein